MGNISDLDSMLDFMFVWTMLGIDGVVKINVAIFKIK